MNAADLTALLPLLVLTATAIIVMLAIAVGRHHGLVAGLTLAGLVAGFASLWPAAAIVPRRVTKLLVIDDYALFYLGLIIAASFCAVILAYSYLETQQINREEFYVLLLTATIGAGVLVASNHYASFFLGLEILSVSLYALVSYLNTRRISLEAGIKYLVLAAASAAFLLFGIALIYAALGSLEFSGLAQAISSGVEIDRAEQELLLTGIALVITGFGFKLAVVPFHLWTPDVYQGAPAPVTAYIATVSKGAMFAILLRYFSVSGARHFASIHLIFAIMAIASMFTGNLLALLQNNVKRILAYSSIAHLGYLLVAFEVAARFQGMVLGASAATFYLVAYFVTTLGAFGVVTVLSNGQRDADALEDYRGLFWQRPGVAGIFTAMLLSLAGIPLTAGFLGKFYIVAAGAARQIWALIIILVLTSGIGLFYYLRIVVTMFMSPPDPAASRSPGLPAAPLVTRGLLVALTILLVWFGVYPRALLETIQTAIASLH